MATYTEQEDRDLKAMHTKSETESERQRVRGMVVSVGGTSDPIIFSLQEVNPRRVLFVASSSTVEMVEREILTQAPEGVIADYCVVTNEQNLESCYREIRDCIRGWLPTSRIGEGEVSVDFTGGTKAMSAALVMAGMEWFSQFHYVGGRRRNKSGVGVVETGSEFVVNTSNPWEVEAWKERERAASLYETVQPAEASRVLALAKSRCGEATGKILKVYQELLNLFALADRFDFKELDKKVRSHEVAILALLAAKESAETLRGMQTLLVHWSELNMELWQGGHTPKLLEEILCNADRRAKQAKWDDAVARLYRATELWVQGIAFAAFGGALGRVPMDGVADERRDAFIATFGPANEKGYWVLPLKRLVEAVYAFSEHPEREAVSAAYEKLSSHLAKRNGSILAHGVRPASGEDYEKFRAALLQAMRRSEAMLPEWPVIRFGISG